MRVGEVSGAEPPNSADDRVGIGHRDVALLHAGRVRHGLVNVGDSKKTADRDSACLPGSTRLCGFRPGAVTKYGGRSPLAAISRGAPSVSKRTGFGVS
jgi:hypothetical protein